MAHGAIAGLFILVIAGGVGLGVASADSSDDLARAGAFGFDEATHVATLSASPAMRDASSNDAFSFDQLALSAAAVRDISTGLRMIDEKEVAEQLRLEAENAAAIERMEAEKAKQGVYSSDDGDGATDAVHVIEYDLPKVDWSVGREAFVTEWATRIDAYLAGSPLAGYGVAFAEAAWDNGVDPRWSPAISNTESSKGARCFLPHNAWGWGSSSWPDWETAINAHVAGLAASYGYSITLGAAQAYCPPNYSNWYNNTINQMAII